MFIFTIQNMGSLFAERVNKPFSCIPHRTECCDIILLFAYRSVQMRLYSMHKREFVMVFLAFFACFGLGLFIGLAGK
jgi:hypothetical protein